MVTWGPARGYRSCEICPDRLVKMNYTSTEKDVQNGGESENQKTLFTSISGNKAGITTTPSMGLSRGHNYQIGATPYSYTPGSGFQYTGGSGFAPSYQYPRRVPGDRQIIPDRSGSFMRRIRMGGIGQTLNRTPEPITQKSSEPEHDEAFVEESGIKLFTPSAPSKPPHLDNIEDNESEEEDEDVSEDEDEDPLYELDVMDDTIVEEGEEDDDDEDNANHQQTKESNNSTENKNDVSKKEIDLKDADKKPKETQNIPKQPLVSQVLTPIMNSVMQPKLQSQYIPLTDQHRLTSHSSSSSNSSSANSSRNNSSSASSGGGYGLTSGPIPNQQSSDGNKVVSGNVNSTTKRDSYSSNSSRDSGMGEISTVTAAGDLAVSTVDHFSRGRSGRMSLPLPRTSKPHKFIIRKVSETEAPARRTTGFIDSRMGELRSPESAQGRGPIPRAMPSPIWVKRHQVE